MPVATLASRGRTLALELLDLLAPPRCVACDAPHPAHPPSAPALCAPCAATLEPALALPPGVLAPFAYGGPLARAILRAKHDPSPAPAHALGRLLAHAAQSALPAGALALPVPLHPARLRTRSFNQAREMARALGMPLATGAVRRTRDTPAQRGLGRAARLQNVRAAFAPMRAGVLEGATVVVVDDVVTTGATFSAVAEAAYAGGSARVVCLALARAELAG